jgi:hypothetical protein
MLGSVVLDVAIGMAFVYLLLSLIASVAQEILAAFLQLRPANLLRGMRSLFSGGSLGGQDLTDAIYNHGLVRGLYSDPSVDLKLKSLAAAVDSAKAEAAAADAAYMQATAALAALDQTADDAATQKLVRDKTLEVAMAQRKSEYADDTVRVRAEMLDRMQQPMGLRVKLGNVVRNRLQQWVGIPREQDVVGVSNQALLPAYIPSRTFALALIDILNEGNVVGSDAMTAIEATLSAEFRANGHNMAVEALKTLALAAKGDLDTFRRNVENWYNDSMDRASGWYKRYTQRILFCMGLGLALLFNVDSVRVAKTLWFDRDTRQAMVSAASDYAAKQKTVGAAESPACVPPLTNGAAPDPDAKPGLTQKLCDTVTAFNQVTEATLLPLGWDGAGRTYWRDFFPGTHRMRWTGAWFMVVLHDVWTAFYSSLGILAGWLLTGMAISLGAPFWFDTLNKFMVVRSTVKPREKSQTEASKDSAASTA